MAEELEGADIFDNWDQLIQSPEATPSSSLENLDISGLIGQEKKGEEYWEKIFQESNLGGMKLMSLNYYPRTIHEEDFFKTCVSAQKLFIKDILAYCSDDLRIAGLSEESIFYLTKGILPVNWTVHLKVPPLYGGQASPENMVLIQCQPFHEKIHDFINQQILSEAGVGHPKILYVPTPIGKVYVPKENG